ncbi:hypothetical protein ATI61_101110 [Archangium gephyra]|uniref:Uncharacterized protein n=1 Tax=Archangium gephyra TaxID=48 RepID=A0ABX9KAY9_9BACT|nr:hypothetical protein ATI61_101110 [Archangium gephyra]
MCGGCGWFLVGAVALLVLRSALKTLELYLSAWLDAKELLAEVHPPGEAELEAFVPPQYWNPGPAWTFTRGKLLSTSGSRRQGEHVEYTRYDGVYGYYDDRGRLRLHRMESGDDDRAFRPGRLFIILYNRERSREHRVFEMRRWW